MHITPWRVARLLSPLLPILYTVFQWHPAIRPNVEWGIVILVTWLTALVSVQAMAVILDGPLPDRADRMIATETTRPITHVPWAEIEKTVAQLLNSNKVKYMKADVADSADVAKSLTGRFECADIPMTQMGQDMAGQPVFETGRHRLDDTQPRLFTHTDDDLYGGRDRG